MGPKIYAFREEESSSWNWQFSLSLRKKEGVRSVETVINAKVYFGFITQLVIRYFKGKKFLFDFTTIVIFTIQSVVGKLSNYKHVISL